LRHDRHGRPDLLLWRVGTGQHNGAFQVALGDDLEQCGGGFAGHRQVAQFIIYAEPGTMPIQDPRWGSVVLRRWASGGGDLGGTRHSSVV
jgi:hypothetical protein